MTVTVKLNNVVWALTGRSAGFVYPMLNTLVSIPPVSDARIHKARRILRLDTVGTDFYVYGALTALYASMFFLREFDTEHQAAFIPGVIPASCRTSDVYDRLNGEIVYSLGDPVVLADSGNWTFLPFYDESLLSSLHNPINWDYPHDALHLELDGTDVIVSRYWLGTLVDSQTIPAVDVTGDVVRLDALAYAGLKASFDTNGTTVTWLNAPPTTYPYARLRAQIADDAVMVGLMLDAGTIEAFFEAANDMAAVGALAAAIVRTVRTDGPDYQVELEAGPQNYVEPIISDVSPNLDLPVTMETVNIPCNE